MVTDPQGSTPSSGVSPCSKQSAARFALIAAVPAAAAYNYVTTDAPGLGVLGTVVTSINNFAEATGYYVTYDPNTPPGAFGAYTAFTVNADGTGFTPFVRPGYAQTGAAGINDFGDISGVSVTAGGIGTGFIRSGFDGSYTDIDPNLGGITALYSEAIGINNSGWASGFYVTDPAATIASLEFYSHGFITDGTSYLTVDIDPTIGFGTRVVSINDAGIISGTYLDNSADHFRHPFIGFGPGTLIPLDPDPLGVPASELGNITLSGYATYNSLFPNPMSPLGYVTAAFVLDLFAGAQEPIDAPGALFTQAFGISEFTDVTGLYVDGIGLHGFIATFVPEPATWALLIVGFGLTGATLRRRRETSARAIRDPATRDGMVQATCNTKSTCTAS